MQGILVIYGVSEVYLHYVYNCDDRSSVISVISLFNYMNFIPVYCLREAILQGYITNSHNDQLPVGLLAQLVRMLCRYLQGS